MRVALSDGMLQFRGHPGDGKGLPVHDEAQNSGILTSHKGIAFPGKHVAVAAFTEKGPPRPARRPGQPAGAVALSFVQTPEDVLDLLGRSSPGRLAAHRGQDRDPARGGASQWTSWRSPTPSWWPGATWGWRCRSPNCHHPEEGHRAARHTPEGGHRGHPDAPLHGQETRCPPGPRPPTWPTPSGRCGLRDALRRDRGGSLPVETVAHHAGHRRERGAIPPARQGGLLPAQRGAQPSSSTWPIPPAAGDTWRPRPSCATPPAGATAAHLQPPAVPGIYSLTPDGRVLRALNFFWGVKPRIARTACPATRSGWSSSCATARTSRARRTGDLTAGQPTPGRSPSTPTSEDLLQVSAPAPARNRPSRGRGVK
jgi:pyruvate kinase